jgi:endoglucanase Acf2
MIDKNTKPKIHFIKSIYILILFILFTKNTLRMTIVIGLCMILLFIIEDYINYYKNIKNIEKVNQLNKISMNLKYIILILIIVGHLLYIVKQKTWFGDNFDIFRLYKSEKCSIV